jgi:ribose transport system ATP-binding protein
MVETGARLADLELRGLAKRFGHVTALDGVDLSAYAGQVLAVVGDNGAGKSTLIKIVSGVYRADRGEILVAGEPTTFGEPADARRAGVATVFQDLALVEVLDVSTNMFLGQLPRRGWFVSRKTMDAQSRRFLDDLKVTVPSVRCGPERTPCCWTSPRQRWASARRRMRRISSGSCVIVATP